VEARAHALADAVAQSLFAGGQLGGFGGRERRARAAQAARRQVFVVRRNDGGALLVVAGGVGLGQRYLTAKDPH